MLRQRHYAIGFDAWLQAQVLLVAAKSAIWGRFMGMVAGWDAMKTLNLSILTSGIPLQIAETAIHARDDKAASRQVIRANWGL